MRDFPKILTIEGQPTMHLHISPMPQNSLSKILFAKINCLTGSSCQRGCVEIKDIMTLIGPTARLQIRGICKPLSGDPETRVCYS